MSTSLQSAATSTGATAVVDDSRDERVLRLTAREFAEYARALGLTRVDEHGRLCKMPTTDRGIEKLARRLGATPREERGAGGTEKRWPISIADETSQHAIILARVPCEKELVVRALGSTARESYAKAAEPQRSAAAERTRILEMVRALRRVGVANAVERVAIETSRCARTIYRWLDVAEENDDGDVDPASLLPAKRGPASRVVAESIGDEEFKAFMKDYGRVEEPTLAGAHRRFQTAFQIVRGVVALCTPAVARGSVEGWTVPSRRTFYRMVNARCTPTELLWLRKGREAYKQKQPSIRRHRRGMRPFDWVSGDGWEADVFIRFEDGRIGTVHVIGWIDVYSGKVLAWRMAEEEDSDVIRGSIADLVRICIPINAQFDNGRAFNALEFTGGHEHRYRNGPGDDSEPLGVWPALGVVIHNAKPRNGRAKPIERTWRDLVDAVARHPFCRGAYRGPGPQAKPENYGSRAIPLKEFHEHFARCIEEYNAQSDRESPTCKGRSFNETFDELFYADDFVPRRATEEQIQFLLMPPKRVRVPANGEAVITVRVLDQPVRFWNPKLVDFAGRELVLRYDPLDLKRAFVFRDHGPEVLFDVEQQPELSWAIESRDDIRRESRARKIEEKAAEAAAAIRTGARIDLPGAPPESQTKRSKRKVVAGHFGIPKRSTIEIPRESEHAREREEEERANSRDELTGSWEMLRARFNLAAGDS